MIETMRRLPIERMAGAPRSVLGLCIVRGSPIPVVDLQALLAEPEAPHERMVTLRVGSDVVAVAVDSVLGVRSIDLGESNSLPPLLREAAGDVVSAIGTLDAEFLLFLRSARIVPPIPSAPLGLDEVAA